jgi:putative transposase
MKKQKFSETQILKALKEYESGINAMDICRDLGIHKSTLYTWNKKYNGMDGDDIKRLKELEEENRRLKKMYAELAMDNSVLKDVIAKKF